jgi:hypothetical protein
MKVLMLGLLVTASFVGTDAFAQSSSHSPLLGHWVLDVNSLSMPAQARPKSVTLDFQEPSSGILKTHVEIVDQSGNRMYSDSTLPLDGSPGKASGTYWVDVLAASMPAPNVLVMQFVYEKIPRSTRVFSVSPDGKTLTETETYFAEDGTPVTRPAIFLRSDKAP